MRRKNKKLYHKLTASNNKDKSLILSFIKTFFAILLTSSVMIAIATVVCIMNSFNNVINLDLHALQLDMTSYIYVNDKNGAPVQYQQVYASETRIWADYDKIPQSMKDAMVAIEDKRFYQHSGVDWKRTAGAILKYLTGGSDIYGGSTITQQLIKNLTNKKEVSISRKVGEIFTALELENKYSKDEILECYLNVVNYGGGCNGVQAASHLYFGKDISECSIAECASIAGITQNPTAHNPLLHPEANKKRQQTVLGEMYSQEYITKEQYDEAIKQSNNMSFVGEVDDGNGNTKINNWYIEAMLNDITKDLSEKYNVDTDTAQYMLMHSGYKIYSAMDSDAQSIAESVIANNDDSVLPKDKGIQVGYCLMGYDGRVLASIGQRGQKTANMLWDCANIAQRQPGSSIKPIAVYAPAMEEKLICYSSVIKDQPLYNLPGTTGAWPPNWYGYYRKALLLPKAIEISSNACSAQTLHQLGLDKSFDFLTNKLGFTNLNPDVDKTYSGLATGGGYNGVTVKEMTAAFQIFGNGGIYYSPYTYYYIEDMDGNIILDNRNASGTQAISSGNSTIMRHVLYNVIQGSSGTGRAAAIPGWEVFGKTGTTNNNENSWFIGGTPYAVGGIWTGYETPKTIGDTAAAIRIWKAIMNRYLNLQENKQFIDDPQVVQLNYNSRTGFISDSASNVGYYMMDNLPNKGAGVTVEDNDNYEKTTQQEESVSESETSEESEETIDESSSSETSSVSSSSESSSSTSSSSSKSSSSTSSSTSRKPSR